MTNKQLRDWLKRFPDDCIIRVVVTEDASRAYYSDVSVYTEALELPDIEMRNLTWEDYGNVDFDIVFDYDQGVCVGVNSITLGKNHHD